MELALYIHEVLSKFALENCSVSTLLATADAASRRRVTCSLTYTKTIYILNFIAAYSKPPSASCFVLFVFNIIGLKLFFTKVRVCEKNTIYICFFFWKAFCLSYWIFVNTSFNCVIKFCQLLANRKSWTEFRHEQN